MHALSEALSQLGVARACVEQVLAGLETVGAFQLVSYLRDMLFAHTDVSCLAHPGQQRVLALACQELCWEKIHTGNWKEVHI